MNFSGKYGIEAQQLDAERAAQAGEARADGEGGGKDQRSTGMPRPRATRAIVDGGAQAAAEARARQAGLQPDGQRAAQHDQEGAVDADADAQDLPPPLQPVGQLDVALARAQQVVGRAPPP